MLSQGRFSILMLLNRHPDQPETPASLAQQAGVSRATITGLLDNLEKDGLITRGSALSDRRLTPIHLTPKGAELMDSVLPKYFQHVAKLLETLNSEERIQLVGLLQKIQHGIAGPELESPETLG
jgi:DNA-binding MarR family transcriptional regulator